MKIKGKIKLKNNLEIKEIVIDLQQSMIDLINFHQEMMSIYPTYNMDIHDDILPLVPSNIPVNEYLKKVNNLRENNKEKHISYFPISGSTW